MGKALVEGAEKAEFGFPASYTAGYSDVSGTNPSTMRWDGSLAETVCSRLKESPCLKITERSIREFAVGLCLLATSETTPATLTNLMTKCELNNDGTNKHTKLRGEKSQEISTYTTGS